MSTEIQRRGGTTAEHSTFTGVEREITIDTDKKTVVVHDGSTAGGFPLSASSHTHTADEILGGSGITLSVSSGGTGASTAVAALSNLGGAPALSETEYVSNQSAFALAYAGGPKTILLGANSYLMPATFIPGINLVHQGSTDDVQLVGNLDAAVSGASALITTVWQNLTVDGDIEVNAPFDTTLELMDCRHINGQMNIAASTLQGEIRYVLGSVEQFITQAINLKMLGTMITKAGSQVAGSAEVRLLSVTAEVTGASATQSIIDQTGGTTIIQAMRWSNPDGRGIALSGSAESTIDGFILSGSLFGDGLTFGVGTTLNLGTHNLPSGKLIDGGGTLNPLPHPIVANSVTSAEIESGAVESIHITASAVSRTKLVDELRLHHQEVILPTITASGPGAANEVIWGYVNGYRQIESIRMQTLASTVVTADVEVLLHETRVSGSAFPASTTSLVAGIAIGKDLSDDTLAASVTTGQAISLDFTNFAGGSVLNNLMVSLTFRI